MPELPEVEVVKLFLEDCLLDQKISSIDILNPNSFIGNPQLIVGQTITKFTRVGKQLSIHLANKSILLVHLKMTGQLILVKQTNKTIMGHPTKDAFTAKLPNRSTRLIFHFSSGHTLFFNDQRKFGWVKIYTQAELVEAQKDLGCDIFDDRFTPEYLFTQLQRTSRPVKIVLLDQHFFAGIGNIYANDALFLSLIHPSTPANKVERSKASKLHNSLISIMRQSVLAGGSTMKDNKYVRPDGTYGGNQFFFRVYQRAGEPCLNCSAPIQKISLGGRGTFYCPYCQQ